MPGMLGGDFGSYLSVCFRTYQLYLPGYAVREFYLFRSGRKPRRSAGYCTAKSVGNGMTTTTIVEEISENIFQP